MVLPTKYSNMWQDCGREVKSFTEELFLKNWREIRDGWRPFPPHTPYNKNNLSEIQYTELF